MKSIRVEEVPVRRGCNAHENWDLIDSSDPSWLWLHLDSFPSPHVVVEHEAPSGDVLLAAAEFCRDGSKYHRLRNLKVCYTKVSNLKKGGAPGSVEYRSNRQVRTIRLR